MYVFVPQQCSFFVIEEALASHRIDPKTDEELRRAAIEEKMTTQNVTSTTIKQNVTSTLTTILSTKTTILNQTTTLKPKIPPANEKHTKTEDLSKKKANEAPRVVQNATAIVGMNHYDPIDIIDIGEKWGFDIGIDN
jgi:NaMN:DMB phosphoribosyltransferase